MTQILVAGTVNNCQTKLNVCQINNCVTSAASQFSQCRSPPPVACMPHTAGSGPDGRRPEKATDGRQGPRTLTYRAGCKVAECGLLQGGPAGAPTRHDRKLEAARTPLRRRIDGGACLPVCKARGRACRSTHNPVNDTLTGNRISRLDVSSCAEKSRVCRQAVT